MAEYNPDHTTEERTEAPSAEGDDEYNPDPNDNVIAGDPFENETEEEKLERKRKMREYEQSLKDELDAEDAEKAKAASDAAENADGNALMDERWLGMLHRIGLESYSYLKKQNDFWFYHLPLHW